MHIYTYIYCIYMHIHMHIRMRTQERTVAVGSAVPCVWIAGSGIDYDYIGTHIYLRFYKPSQIAVPCLWLAGPGTNDDYLNI